VDLVLVPLLGTGLIQAVQCTHVLRPSPAFPNGNCDASITPTPLNAFRVGTDGLVAPLPAASATLPQPTFPGINDVSAAAGEALDVHFRPNVVDSFDLTIQRQLTNKVLLEVGYIGRRITHEYQPININAVPHMMTLGGQKFSAAYAAVEKGLGCNISINACGASLPPTKICTANCGTATPTLSPNPAYAQFFNALPAQPFFETALSGTGYCTGSYAGVALTSCTANAAFNELGNFETQSVWSLWSDLDNGGFNFPRSMLNTPLPGPNGGNGQLSSGVGVNASVGHGNYNAGFVSLKVTNWRGLTLQQNFTYSKALGTGAFVQATSEYTPNDAFNINNMYGVQNFDRKFVYNIYGLYDPPFFKGQHGLAGHVLGGWQISPVLAIGSGAPVYCFTNTNGQSFGSADGANFFSNEQCIYTKTYGGGSSVRNGIAGSGGVGEQDCTKGPCLNMFANPEAVFSTVRNPILGIDNGTGGVGAVRGLAYWNVDMRVTKNVKIIERVSAEFQFVMTNLFNHPQFFDPTLDITNPAGWGVISSQGNNPRAMQFGIRLSF